jgi:plastocyanin
MKSFFQIKNITNTLLLFFSFSTLSLILFSLSLNFATAQEEIITIVPGSSDSSRYRFFDITEYPIVPGEEIKWYNADNIIHNIIVTSTTGEIIVAQSGNIKPKEYFTYKFDKEGEYLFKSANYNWMKGKIIVTEDIKTIKKGMENDIDLFISWSPSSPSTKVEEKTIFKIIFVDKKSEGNQEHIDYSFTIHNSTSNTAIYKNAVTHSAWGVEPASYKFDSSGTFIGKVRIEGFLFQPIEPDSTEFEIQVN